MRLSDGRYRQRVNVEQFKAWSKVNPRDSIWLILGFVVSELYSLANPTTSPLSHELAQWRG